MDNLNVMHLESMPVYFDTLNLTLYKKTRVYKGIHFCSKTEGMGTR